MKKTDLSYLRTSVRRKGKISIDSQQQLITKKADKLGQSQPTYFIDEGFSGYTMNRPSFKELQNNIKMSKEPRTLYIYRYDRISRNLKLALDFLDICFEYNVKVISIMESLPETVRHNKSLEKLFISILFSMAEFTRESLIENQRIALNKKVQMGVYLTAKVPYGYRWSKEKQQPILVEEEADNIRAIFSLYLSEQFGYGTLAKELEEVGRKIRGKPFCGYHIRAILTNQFYIGIIQGGKASSYQGKHEQIVTEKQFQQVQIIRESRQTTKKSTQIFPLRQKVTCPFCQSTLTCGTRRTSLRYYYCSFCKKMNMSADKLEQAVLSSLNHYLTNEAVFQSLVSELSEQVTLINSDKQEKIQDKVNKKNSLLTQFENGEISTEAFTNRLKQLNSEQQSIQHLFWNKEKEQELSKLLALKEAKIAEAVLEKVLKIIISKEKKLKEVIVDGLSTSIKTTNIPNKTEASSDLH